MIESTSAPVCIANISLRERRKRLASGIVGLIFGLAILAGLVAFGVPRGWRLALLPIFAGAATGFFQWRDRT